MNHQKQWIPRMICLGLILALLGLYQNSARVWAENQAANQAAVDAANAHNQEVLAEMAAREAVSASDPEESPALGPYRTAATPRRPGLRRRCDRHRDHPGRLYRGHHRGRRIRRGRGLFLHGGGHFSGHPGRPVGGGGHRFRRNLQLHGPQERRGGSIGGGIVI